jgi:AcrR family transcriptional regulator
MARQRMKGIDRRRQIMKVAQRLFAQRGYSMTTTAAIASAAGVTEPILYRHFESKRDLFLQLLGIISQEVLARARQLASESDDPMEQLRGLMLGYPEMSQRFSEPFSMIDRSLASMGGARGRGDRSMPDVRPLLADHHREYEALISDIIRRGQAAGKFRRDLDPQVAAWVLINAAIGWRLSYTLQADVFNRSHYIPQTVQMLLDSVAI